MAPHSSIPKDSASAPNGEVSLASSKEKALQLLSIRNSLPASVFEKSLTRSLYYLFFDYFMWLGSLALFYTLRQSAMWPTLHVAVQTLAYVAFINFAGFFMWGIFVVGHDCGHGTFSNYEWLNDILGHITHGSIMVPFYPWQLSHRRHHMYHNHVDKDYSFPWYTEERLQRPDEGVYRFLDKSPIIRSSFPLYGWFVYLLGKPDGNHFVPLKSDRIWAESNDTECNKCIISTLSVIANAYFIYQFCGSFANMAYYYIAPLFVFGWWIVTVTYLQHHDPHTQVYDDSNWNYVTAAFETVDRTYGSVIDNLSHHITDGHVVHHLFFTKIPHYNLPDASIALRKYMKENGLMDIYRYEDTYDFMLRVHKYFYLFGFKSAEVKVDAPGVSTSPATVATSMSTDNMCDVIQDTKVHTHAKSSTKGKGLKSQ